MEHVDSACGKCECNRNSLIPSTRKLQTHTYTHIYTEKKHGEPDVSMSRFLFLWICVLPLSQLRAFLYTDGISRERKREKDVSMFKEARAYIRSTTCWSIYGRNLHFYIQQNV